MDNQLRTILTDLLDKNTLSMEDLSFLNDPSNILPLKDQLTLDTVTTVSSKIQNILGTTWYLGEKIILEREYLKDLLVYAKTFYKGKEWVELEVCLLNLAKAVGEIERKTYKDSSFRTSEEDDNTLLRFDTIPYIDYLKLSQKSLWLELESLILDYRLFSLGVDYAKLILKGPWKELENLFVKAHEDYTQSTNSSTESTESKESSLYSLGNTALEYTKEVLKKPWDKAENIILDTQSEDLCLEYAFYVLKGPWLKAEAIFYSKKSHSYLARYEQIPKKVYTRLYQDFCQFYPLQENMLPIFFEDYLVENNCLQEIADKANTSGFDYLYVIHLVDYKKIDEFPYFVLVRKEADFLTKQKVSPSVIKNLCIKLFEPLSDHRSSFATSVYFKEFREYLKDYPESGFLRLKIHKKITEKEKEDYIKQKTVYFPSIKHNPSQDHTWFILDQESSTKELEEILQDYLVELNELGKLP